VTAKISGVGVGYFQSLDLFGHYGNITLSIPYAWGPIRGLVDKEPTRITRSGLGDPRLRLTVNLAGAPALSPREFAGYQQKTNLGLGFVLSAPLGQYDLDKLLNLGANRWAFKPELGVSHRRGPWLIEGAGGVWLFGANNRFMGTSKREQDPVVALQGHVIYHFPKRIWLALNGNFFTGGGARVDGVRSSAPVLRNSRLGATLSIPLHRRHSLQISFHDGVVTRLGTDFQRLAVSYQFVWLGL
jgi:hypothetical protein